MLHWQTKEEMGEGFLYDELDHKENDYNHLVDIECHEKITLRTKYLISDVWSLEQLKELQEYLNTLIKDKEIDEACNFSIQVQRRKRGC